MRKNGSFAVTALVVLGSCSLLMGCCCGQQQKKLVREQPQVVQESCAQPQSRAQPRVVRDEVVHELVVREKVIYVFEKPKYVICVRQSSCCGCHCQHERSTYVHPAYGHRTENPRHQQTQTGRKPATARDREDENR
jgi:hypothetical protein